jgi:aflatoxin B1 aldehyde reductase
MEDFEKGPLSSEMLKAVDNAWDMCRGVTWKYFH